MFERGLTLTRIGRRLVVAGSVDECCLAELRAALDDLVRAERTVVVELSDVDHLPSAGVGVLAVAQTAARERGVEVHLVAGVGSPAHQVLSSVGVPHLTGPVVPPSRRSHLRVVPDAEP